MKNFMFQKRSKKMLLHQRADHQSCRPGTSISVSQLLSMKQAAKITYCKSSIKPPGGLFFSSTFEGGLNREGGLI